MLWGCVFLSFQFSRSFVSNFLQPHQLQHTRPPCPSPALGVYSVMSIKLVMPSNHLVLYLPIKLSYNTCPSVTTNFCCSKTEPRKLHTHPTYKVPWLRFNLFGTISAQPLQGRGQAQQKSSSAEAPTVEAECKENPVQGEWQVGQHAGNWNWDSKNKLSRKLSGSVSASRRHPVGVGSPHSYGWKDRWLTKC